MLIENPQHGYKIIEDIHLIYNVFLSPGTLYPALYDLQKRGLVVVKKGSRKKVYYPTLKGKKEFLKMEREYKSNTHKIFKILDNITSDMKQLS